jgi:hypothetical protein
MSGFEDAAGEQRKRMTCRLFVVCSRYRLGRYLSIMNYHNMNEYEYEYEEGKRSKKGDEMRMRNEK